MDIICWLDDYGVITPSLKPGEIYQANYKSNIEFRILLSSSFLSDVLYLIFDLSRLLFTNSYKGYYFASVVCNTPGKIDFCLEYIDPVLKKTENSAVSSILVQPEIKINGKVMHPGELCFQTNLSRSLGPLADWKASLASQIDLGYNFFHITAVQKLGINNSLYSIGDYQSLNDGFFSTTIPEDDKINKLKETVNEIDEAGGGMIIDVILNHCSSICPLLCYPNAVYSLSNTPHLYSAYVLDSALLSLSEDMHENSHKYPTGNKIHTCEDVEKLMIVVKDVIKNLRLFEFFQMNTEDVINHFIQAEDQQPPLQHHVEYLNTHGLKLFIRKICLTNRGETRYGVKLNYKTLWNTCKHIGMPSQNILKEVIKEIPTLNSLLLSKFNRYLQRVHQNIESEIKYHKVELRVFEVSVSKPLVKSYFTTLPNGEVCLLNGFVIDNKDIRKDISGKWEYFKRNVISWRDCVKLKYGQSRLDCPELWDGIQKYVETMAGVFKGFRLDNCHGTPLHVSQYFVEKARKINPNLLIVSEFFSSSQELDTTYVSAIGINYLIRESMPHKTLNTIIPLLSYDYPNNLITKIPVLLYDFTHDNPTIPQSRCTEDCLPNSAIVSMSINPVSSTRGYDEVIPVQLSVLEETRPYITYGLSNALREVRVMDAKDNIIKVTVYYKGPAKYVEIKGDWDGWKYPIILDRYKNTFAVCLVFPSSQRFMEYGFKYCVDTKWIHDESQRFYKTWDGYFNNLLRVEENLPQLYTEQANLREFRLMLNSLKKIIYREGYFSLQYMEMDNGVNVILRENPATLHAYVVIFRSGLSRTPGVACKIPLTGCVSKVEYMGYIKTTGVYTRDPNVINGIPIKVEAANIQDFGCIKKESSQDIVYLKHLPPGSVIIMKTRPDEEINVIEINKAFLILEDYSRCKSILDGLDLRDVSIILWRTDVQEYHIRRKNIYKFPEFNNVLFSGIASLYTLFQDQDIHPGHPVYKNLYNGDWYLDYQLSRMQSISSQPLYYFIHDLSLHIKKLQRKYVPGIVVKLFKLLYLVVKEYTVTRLIDTLVYDLDFLFYSTQLILYEKNSVLVSDLKSAQMDISFEYFFTINILTYCGLFKDARDILCKIASEYKNGLIKDHGNSLYFLYAVYQYIENTPDGLNILNESINIRNEEYLRIDVICFNILEFYAMNILDRESGLVLFPKYQTWRKDSPRDGAPIEVISILYRVLVYFSSNSSFPQAVSTQSGKLLLGSWVELIKNSFEDLYWIPSKGYSIYIRPELVTVSGVYKNCVGCKDEPQEYKCCPSLFIAMAISPDLFSIDSAIKCLKTIKEILILPETEAWKTAFYYISALHFQTESPGTAWKFIFTVKNDLGRTFGSESQGLTYATIVNFLKILNINS